ncbi:MAG: isoprenylcysteine carboxylmethyltransferase family protein [Gammaproteobacteria bacterium]|nr:isoprenylcysteine carboxylmethyltransferase family protein [Gammaproteobacteria bacterium]
MFSFLELKILPPVVALIAAGLMWLLSHYIEMPVVDFQYKLAICSLWVGLGLGVDFLAIWQFRRSKTTVNPLRPNNATSLVNAGIYQYTRNPMYLGNFMFLTAWLIWLGSPVNLVGLIFYVSYINQFQIKPEERALISLFGDSYSRYRKSVRRWI